MRLILTFFWGLSSATEISSNEWSCEKGDYLIWNGIKAWSTGQTKSVDTVTSAGECRAKCDEEKDWCKAFWFDIKHDMRCVLIQKLAVSTSSEGWTSVTGMRCDHTPHSSPHRDPDGHLWSSCSNHYHQAVTNPTSEAIVPQCDTNGKYRDEQCNNSTGYCHCMNEFGVQILESKNVGTANCEKYKNYEPDTKVEMLGAEFTELIHQQLNGSRSLVRRASKIIGRMSHDYKKKLSKCEDYAGTEHGEDNRSSADTPCDHIDKLMMRLKMWSITYNSPCKALKRGNFLTRVNHKLNYIHQNFKRRGNC